MGAYSYLDDIIVYSLTLDEHINNLETVFECLRKHNFKLKIEKSLFLHREVKYLGHIISEKGTRPDPEKTTAIEKYNKPRNVNEVQRFLGCCNYYRKYIKNYANIARPMHNLCKKEAVFIWTENCEEAFSTLKNALMSEPLLIFPDFKDIFIVTCDASNTAIGAVLPQGTIPNDRPIQYYSKTLNDAQTRYPTIEKELLAIVAAVENFRHYLYGKRFILYTDHRPLLYIMKNKKPSSRQFRWKPALLEYDFEIFYKEGKQNVVADALSRITLDELTDLEDKEKKILVTTRSTMRREEEQARLERIQTNLPALFIEEKNNILFDSRNVDHIFCILGKNLCELQKKIEIKLKKTLPKDMKAYNLYQLNNEISTIILPPLIRNNEQIDKARMTIGIMLDHCTAERYERLQI